MNAWPLSAMNAAEYARRAARKQEAERLFAKPVQLSAAVLRWRGMAAVLSNLFPGAPLRKAGCYGRKKGELYG